MENQKFIGTFEAKTKFSSIISEVKNNNINYIVTKRGEPIAIISPYFQKKSQEIINVINNFIDYRNNKALKLDRSKGIAVQDIIHHNHKYHE